MSLAPVARASDPATSHAASPSPHSRKTIMAALLAEFYEVFPAGLIAHEAAAAAGYTAEDGAWKRVSDLKNEGYIKPLGTEEEPVTRMGPKGKACIVWQITGKGNVAHAYGF